MPERKQSLKQVLSFCSFRLFLSRFQFQVYNGIVPLEHFPRSKINQKTRPKKNIPQAGSIEIGFEQERCRNINLLSTIPLSPVSLC